MKTPRYRKVRIKKAHSVILAVRCKGREVEILTLTGIEIHQGLASYWRDKLKSQI